MTDSDKASPPDHKDQGKIIIVGTGSGTPLTRQSLIEAFERMDKATEEKTILIQTGQRFPPTDVVMPLFADPIIDLTP